jgi:hypothetical protein
VSSPSANKDGRDDKQMLPLTAALRCWIRVGVAVSLAPALLECGGAAIGPATDSSTSTPNQVSVGYGTASLSWTPVTTDTEGTPLSDLAGYHIYYGSSPADMSTSVVVADPSAVAYLVGELAPGTWYFTVAAYTSGGADGVRSNVAAKTIQ